MDLDSLKKSTKVKSKVVDKLEALSAGFKKFKGQGSLSIGRNFSTPDVLSTGVMELDQNILSIGGIALGRVIEIAGETNAGKTTLALNICREAIAAGLSVVIAENEGTFTYEYAEKIGMDPDSYYLLKGAGLTGPQYLEEVMRLAELGADLIVIDSLFGIEGEAASTARLSDAKMNTKQSGAQLVAMFAKLWKNGWKPLTKKSSRLVKGIDGGTTLITINHLKDNFSGYGKDTPGSLDIQFLYSQRIWLERLGMSKDDLDKNGNPIYTRVRVVGKKSKLSPGGRATIMGVDNRNGRFISDSKVLVDLAERKKLIITTKGSGWIRVDESIFELDNFEDTPLIPFKTGMKWNGGVKFVEFINEHTDLLEYIGGFK